MRVAPNWLSFSDLADFEAIYGFNKSVEKGTFYDFGRTRVKGSESIFSAKTDADHREKRRKVFGPALSNAKIVGYDPVISKNAGVFLSRLEQLLQNNNNASDRPINIAGLVHRYTIDTMLEVLYGPAVCPQPYTDAPTTRGIPNSLRVVTKMAWCCSLLPLFGWLMCSRPMGALTRRPTRNKQGELTNMSALAAASQSLIFFHREQLTLSKQPSIVKNWADLPADDSRKMSPSEIWIEAFNLVLAGPGSTAAALTAVLFMLGLPEGQEWQEKIRLEATGLEVKAASVSSSFPVLSAVIKETLRLHPPFPTAFPRTITPGAESSIPNLPAALPPGTVVSANTFVLGRSKQIWGEDVEEWKPQRWLLDSEQARQELEDRFVVFSKGSRQCVGRELALLALTKAVISVARRWELHSVGELKGKSYLEMAYDECWMMFKELCID